MLDLPLATEAGDVLAQPTRARLFTLLGELARPVTTVELAELLDLHVNGVRAHLERLTEAGLVARTSQRGRRGRPRGAWTISSGARPGGHAPRAYADLSRWLARALRRPGDIELGGREIGRELAPERSIDCRTALPIVLTSLGFQPTLEPAPAGRMTLRLENCPYRDAARENPDTVCALHRGITAGLLDVLQPNAKLDHFEPQDPYRAGCKIELSGIPAPIHTNEETP